MGPLGNGRLFCLVCPKPCSFRKAADVLWGFRALKTSNLHRMALECVSRCRGQAVLLKAGFSGLLPPAVQRGAAPWGSRCEPTEPSCCPESLSETEKQHGGSAFLGQGDKAALLSTDVDGKLTLPSVPSPDFLFFFSGWTVTLLCAIVWPHAPYLWREGGHEQPGRGGKVGPRVSSAARSRSSDRDQLKLQSVCTSGPLVSLVCNSLLSPLMFLPSPSSHTGSGVVASRADMKDSLCCLINF